MAYPRQVPFPKQLVAVELPAAGEVFPKKLGFTSRIVAEQCEVQGLMIAFAPTSHPLVPQQEGLADQIEAAELLVEVEGDSAFAAVERAHPVLERALDRLSFDMQVALSIIHTDVTDVTPPLAAGDERDHSTYASYPGDKFARSEDLGSAFTELTPHLRDTTPAPDPKVSAALHWYVKALGAPYLHDRFIFLWIAMEIFADDSGIAVLEPRPLRCGHLVETCPQCSKPTDQKVRGRSIIAYLQARGAEPELAERAWKLRQMMHGAMRFDSGKLADLPAVAQMIRAIVTAELKTALGISESDPPVVVSGVAAIHPAVAAGGTRSITDEDLRWPATVANDDEDSHIAN
jgi:hypothetical protein